MTLGAKPDRLVFYSENDKDTRITLQKLNDITRDMSRKERHERAKENKIKGLIRDYKTS